MADESNRTRPTEHPAHTEPAVKSPPPGSDEGDDFDRESTAAADLEAIDVQAAGAEPGAQDQPQARLAEAEAKAAEYQEAFLRARAEMENVRRRAHEEVAKAHKFAVESFAESLLPVIDSLEAALKVEHASTESMRSGVELTLRQLLTAFEKNRLAAVDPTGQRFDPNLHQAISMVPSDTVPAQHVVDTLQKGFTIADRVLRPALVTVSQGPRSGA